VDLIGLELQKDSTFQVEPASGVLLSGDTVFFTFSYNPSDLKRQVVLACTACQQLVQAVLFDACYSRWL
jgi:hypothetical protein